jgi:hypothetical protein
MAEFLENSNGIYEKNIFYGAVATYKFPHAQDTSPERPKQIKHFQTFTPSPLSRALKLLIFCPPCYTPAHSFRDNEPETSLNASKFITHAGKKFATWSVIS